MPQTGQRSFGPGCAGLTSPAGARVIVSRKIIRMYGMQLSFRFFIITSPVRAPQNIPDRRLYYNRVKHIVQSFLPVITGKKRGALCKILLVEIKSVGLCAARKQEYRSSVYLMLEPGAEQGYKLMIR